MTDNVAEPAQGDRTAPASKTIMPTWLIATISGLFGLFYAYALWNAVAYLVTSATSQQGLNGAGWGVLLFAVFFPILAFGAAFVVGYKRRWWELALALLAGLGLTSVFWLNVLSYAYAAGDSLIAGS